MNYMFILIFVSMLIINQTSYGMWGVFQFLASAAIEKRTGLRPVFSEAAIDREIARKAVEGFWKDVQEKEEREQKEKEEAQERALQKERNKRKNDLYELLSNSNDDCATIARNVGWEGSTHDVAIIKQHILNNAPSLETLERWNRLRTNSFDEEDQEWLENLFLELGLDEES